MVSPFSKLLSMKKVLPACLLVLGVSFLFTPVDLLAQGNLQFNRVLLVSSQQTVPSGKVWKVESAMLNGNCTAQAASGAHMQTNTAYISVNGNAIAVKSAYVAYGTPAQTWSGVSASEMDPTNFPFWLPAGSTLASSTHVTYLSVVEFNVLP